MANLTALSIASSSSASSSITLNAHGAKNPFSDIKKVINQSDGKMIFLGGGQNVGAEGRSYMVRYNSDESLDYSFCYNASDGNKLNNQVYAGGIDSSGNIFIGGLFSNYAGTGQNYFAKILPSGVFDSSFSTSFNSTIHSIAVQSDGKVIVGGLFTNYGSVTGRNSLVRLNTDGTVDTTFCDNAVNSGATSYFNGYVYSLVIQSNGSILVGGSFSNYKTAGRNYLIRLLSDGTLDTAFCTNASDANKFNNSVQTIHVSSIDGSIFLGGLFTSYGSSFTNRFVKLNSSGVFQAIFSQNASQTSLNNRFTSAPNGIYQHSDGSVFVSGGFTNFGAVTGRSYLIKLTSNGFVDTTYHTTYIDGKLGFVSSINPMTDGTILISGAYRGDSVTKANFYRLNPTSGAVTGSMNSGDKILNVIGVQSDKKILVSTDSLNFTNIGLAQRNYVVRLNQNGTIDETFCANAVNGYSFNAAALACDFDSSGNIYLGGKFTNYAGTSGRDKLIKLSPSGIVDNAFCANASDGSKVPGNQFISQVKVQPDQKILVGGNFSNYGGTTGRNGLIRLNSDGTPDSIFCSNIDNKVTLNQNINSLALQPDNAILIGAAQAFQYNGAYRPFLRLNSNGTEDTAFSSNLSINNSVYSVVYVTATNKIIVGGAFSVYGGVANRNYLLMLNQDGTVNTAFQGNVDGALNSVVFSVSITPSGKFLVTGAFTNYGGTGNNYAVLLNQDGTFYSSLPASVGNLNAAFAFVDNHQRFFFNGGRPGSFQPFAVFDKNFNLL